MTSALCHKLSLKHEATRIRGSQGGTKVPATVMMLKMCKTVQEIKQLHAQFIVTGLIDRPPNAGRLVEAYVSASQTCYAMAVFDSIPNPDAFAYNTLIRGLDMENCAMDSLLMYVRLLSDAVAVPDNYTYTFALKACSHAKAFPVGKQIHGQIIKAGVEPNSHTHSSLIHMYSNLGSMDSAERVLAEFFEENVLSMNAIITGYLNQGDVETAMAMFNNMNTKDTATWSIMISGYSKNGMHTEALATFQKMISSGFVPNESTLVSALSACAHLGSLDQGYWIQRFIDKYRFKIGLNLGTALVDMYARCGCIDSSYKVFENMSQIDVVTWGAIISGFAIHGQARKCFDMYDQVIASGVHPNEVIYVAVLSACSRVGYVDMGYHYFHQMVNQFGIKPSVEHYGCMVDLLARAGRLADAEEVISSMPEQPNSVIWGALLNACNIYKDLERGRRAYKKITQLDPSAGDRYKLAGNLFADLGEREDANELRKIVKDKKLHTTSGSSCVAIDGMVHKFVAGDISHGSSEDIIEMLQGTN